MVIAIILIYSGVDKYIYLSWDSLVTYFKSQELDASH